MRDVAVAWASTAGWIRIVGQVTPMPTPMRSVRCRDRSEHRPHERRMSLLVDPRVIVVGDRNEVEPLILGKDGKVDQTSWLVLLARQGEAELDT